MQIIINNNSEYQTTTINTQPLWARLTLKIKTLLAPPPNFFADLEERGRNYDNWKIKSISLRHNSFTLSLPAPFGAYSLIVFLNTPYFALTCPVSPTGAS